MTRELPFVSVVIATFERPTSLADCLDSLARADYPRERYEVVVVDDGGRTDLSDVCGRAAQRVDIRLVRQSNAGAAAARNRGAAAARGDVLLFTDDDCRVSPGWIRACVDALDASPGALVGGRTVNALAENPYASASQLLVNELCCPRGDRQPTFISGNNLATSRAAFARAGGFDETFRTSAGEDRELSARCVELGQPLVYHPDALVEHVSPLTWPMFLRQHLNYGRAAFRLRTHPSPRSSPAPLAGVRFYLALVSAPVDRVAGSHLHSVTVRALLIAAQLATAAGLLAEWMRPRIVAASATKQSVN